MTWRAWLRKSRGWRRSRRAEGARAARPHGRPTLPAARTKEGGGGQASHINTERSNSITFHTYFHASTAEEKRGGARRRRGRQGDGPSGGAEQGPLRQRRRAPAALPPPIRVQPRRPMASGDAFASRRRRAAAWERSDLVVVAGRSWGVQKMLRPLPAAMCSASTTSKAGPRRCRWALRETGRS